MKKLLILLLVMCLPLIVNAQVFNENDEFYVGDSVNVALFSDNDVPSNSKSSDGTHNGNGFHVLKDSKAGEKTVTLIYDGTIEGSPMVYDESNTEKSHEATAILENSLIGQQLNSIINAEGKKWRVEDYSLLTASDLSNLNITKNSDGIYEIPAKYSFLAPIKVEGVIDKTYYNYWTSIQDQSATSTSIYCVSYNEDRTTEDGVWATLVSKDITKESEKEKCAIRPVVIVNKEYILSINNRKLKSAEKNVTTGIIDYFLPLASVIVISGLLIAITKRKELFKTI